MKIIIENTEFQYNTGIRLLKLKNKECPFKEIADVWDNIQPLTFREIAEFENLEHGRIGMVCFGLDRMVKEVDPILVDEQSLEKTTQWVNEKGEIVTKKFNDIYKLFKVLAKHFVNKNDKSWEQNVQDCFFVSCKDTSTDREYLIWVEPVGVYNANNKNEIFRFSNENISAIQAIAWTIQTNVPIGNIEKIIRQGDCILIKPKKMGELLESPRHLTEKEYRNLLVAES